LGRDARHVEQERKLTASYVLEFSDIDRTHAGLVGGKGARLGELSRIEGIQVPAGFCVTTEAFQRSVAEGGSIEDLADRLSRVEPDDREAIRTRCAQIRGTVEALAIPQEVVAAVTRALSRLGEQAAYAVRSSATAEDLPGASFAGLHDSYLNVVGPRSILQHISRCWASLFTERAVVYRLRNGLDHRKSRMAVAVQRMVSPYAAGVLFTADPLTGDRKVAAVEASFGLGEALVSGLVNPDVYRVRADEIVAGTVARKQVAVRALPAGGTHQQAMEPKRQTNPALTDAQVVSLVQLGRRIAAHFDHPQDIEWCLVDDGFRIVQSRPITTVFPVPAQADDGNHVYLSVGHQQMMTEAMKPLGLSFWQLSARPGMLAAGGRLFVDVTQHLASPASRAALLETAGRSDPLIRDALQAVLDRGDFVPSLPDDPGPAQPVLGRAPTVIEPDPAIVTELIQGNRASVAALRRDIGTKTGTALLDFILADLQELKRLLFDPRSHQVFMAAMEASWWLNERLQEWVGERNAADTLTQSVPHNVTAEMGLALLEVADAIRPHPRVVAFLREVHDDGFLDRLADFDGGRQARDAIGAYLDTYGMRCVGEIDITRPRWSEHPSELVPMILSNVDAFAPGEAERRFEQGRRAARDKEAELLARLRQLPEGNEKAEQVKAKIDLVRTFIGYREYPKYGMVSRYFEYKKALLREAGRLVQAGVLRDGEDIFFLTFEELRDVLHRQEADYQRIRERKEAFTSYQSLTPPRVLTSDGEMVTGAYRRDGVPPGAFIGLPVSAGTVEGRARVIRNMTHADLEPGDILVTAYTDPGWTPAFVAISGLVTEVGGLMTHGAVIAREYGLPAVVGVENATRLIRDGQRVRVDGTHGYVEIVPA